MFRFELDGNPVRFCDVIEPSDNTKRSKPTRKRQPVRVLQMSKKCPTNVPKSALQCPKSFTNVPKSVLQMSPKVPYNVPKALQMSQKCLTNVPKLPYNVPKALQMSQKVPYKCPKSALQMFQKVPYKCPKKCFTNVPKKLQPRTTAGALCTCPCKDLQFLSNFNGSSPQMQRMLKELMIDRKNTSKSRMRKESANDNRPSSVSIGAVGVAIVVVPLGLVIVLDIPQLYMDLQKMMTSIKSALM
ncbi:hypothetical protein CHS0354_010088 [Potamilus streckersoni]|uniref:Uncharacterized protein n=1 Tax=Potamilus streckersoni TaxID=2493646 RepID=A0AAE0RR87_9BIVA|nr:hypothetical protein CHS0354_010088 [Potamilus streckersoni]